MPAPGTVWAANTWNVDAWAANTWAAAGEAPAATATAPSGSVFMTRARRRRHYSPLSFIAAFVALFGARSFA